MYSNKHNQVCKLRDLKTLATDTRVFIGVSVAFFIHSNLNGMKFKWLCK